jgi:hypothetical protein
MDSVTRWWSVRSACGEHLLGHVMWWTRWRRYVFVPVADPATDTLHDAKCLRELADFLDEQTKAQRADAEARRAAKAP